jgi:hypothetical protein
MAMNYLTRRKFLTALGAAGAAMPFAKMLESSVAEAQTAAPLRLILMVSPHGTIPELWTPKGGETDFDISYANAILAPLEKYRSQLFIPTGVDMRVLYEKGADTGHQAGPCSLFTGTAAVQKGGDLFPVGPSIDQALAAQFGGVTKFRSVQLGVMAQAGQSSFDSFIFGDGGSRLPSIDDPAKVYTRLFADLMASGSTGADAAAQAVAKKQSVIDYVKGDIGRMSAKLSGPEKAKLDAHLSALRDIESRIGLSAPTGCAKPAQPTKAGSTPDQMPNIGKAQIDLIAQAVACDLSRFFSLQWLYAGNPTEMPWLGLNMNLHDDVAHRISEGQDVRLQLALINNWYASQIAYLMDKLAAIPEGDGTALDNTIIVWGNELGNPEAHDNMDQPFLIAGGAGGKFNMGRCVKNKVQDSIDVVTPSKFKTMTPHNAILTSIAQAFGSQDNFFNDADYTGGLPGLLA